MSILTRILHKIQEYKKLFQHINRIPRNRLLTALNY